MNDNDLISAQDALNKKVLNRRGVTGTAIGLHGGKPCLKVYVSTDDPEITRSLPSRMQGVRVVVEATGTFKRL